MRPAILFLASLVLAACAAPELPRIVNSTPDGVSFAFWGVDIHQVSAAANEYCDQIHKFATLRRVDRLDHENVAIFTCDTARPSR
jgi:hypothetical protein